MASKRTTVFAACWGVLAMMSVPAFAGEGEGRSTKEYLQEAASSGLPAGGLLAGDEVGAIQAKTGSNEPIYVRVERIQDVIGATEHDPTCGRYRVSYSQTGVKDVSGSVIPKPFTFGYDINICADGSPAIAGK